MSPPSLATMVRRSMIEGEIQPKDGFLLACSGGIDSQVLLDTMAHIARNDRNASFRLYAHSVNHGLRADAALELKLVQALAERHQVPFSSTELHVAQGSNLHARARDARYEALRDVAKRLSLRWIVTAHHQEDRAETVLIRMLRGAPLDALAVLPVCHGDLFRPLIRVPKESILHAAKKFQVPFAVDPSNNNERFLRTHVRHRVLPLLRELDPNIVEHLTSWADEAMKRPVETSSTVDQRINQLGILSKGTRKEVEKAIQSENMKAKILLRGARTLHMEAWLKHDEPMEKTQAATTKGLKT